VLVAKRNVHTDSASRQSLRLLQNTVHWGKVYFATVGGQLSLTHLIGNEARTSSTLWELVIPLDIRVARASAPFLILLFGIRFLSLWPEGPSAWELTSSPILQTSPPGLGALPNTLFCYMRQRIWELRPYAITRNAWKRGLPKIKRLDSSSSSTFLLPTPSPLHTPPIFHDLKRYKEFFHSILLRPWRIALKKSMDLQKYVSLPPT